MREELEHALALIEGANGLAIREDASWPMYREAFQTALATTSAPVSAPSPAGGVREPSTQIEDLWFTDSTLPILAISGDDEHDSVICLHYRRPTTNEDRDQVIAALNAALSSPASSSPAEADLRDGVEVNERLRRQASAARDDAPRLRWPDTTGQ